MAIKRTSSARWEGNGKDGKGTVSTPSGVLNDTFFSYKTRFEDAIGTNPEELVAAAHAGCFSMKLAFGFQAENLIPESIDTTSTVVLDEGWIKEAHLVTRVKVSGIDHEKFHSLVQFAKENCPISKSLKAEITIEAEMV